MKFHIENFGPINKASVQLGDLTIICGPNNSGKTYVTYAICIFLNVICKKMAIDIEKTYVDELLNKGTISIKLYDLIPLYIKAVKDIVSQWRTYLPNNMAMNPEKCNESYFSVDITKKELENKLNQLKDIKINMNFKMTNTCELRLIKEVKSTNAQLMLVNQDENMPAFDLVRTILGICLAKIFIHPNIFSLYEQGPIMITCERTGAALFRDQFLISQKLSNGNKENMTQYLEAANSFDFLGYQYPVTQELEYVTRLNEITTKDSSLLKHNPYIFDFFTRMVGGRYDYNNSTNQIHFYPLNNSSTSLRLSEVSSTVKSLLKLNFYLKHQAAAGQMLIFDEPELNLHPANQRNMARLLAMMAQAGIDIFINTHSDYIIREFNTLIHLNNPKLKRLQVSEGYLDQELLSAPHIKVYVSKWKTSGFLLENVPVSQENGITIDTLDEVIDKMNQIQDKIIWRE